MNPGSYPLTLYRGDTYRWLFTLYQDVAQTIPADLTGVTVDSEIRDKSQGNLICTLACTVTLPNTINAVLSATDCGSLPGSAAWDLQLTYPTGDVVTVLAGPVNVTPDVTGSASETPALVRLRSVR